MARDEAPRCEPNLDEVSRHQMTCSGLTGPETEGVVSVVSVERAHDGADYEVFFFFFFFFTMFTLPARK